MLMLFILALYSNLVQPSSCQSDETLLLRHILSKQISSARPVYNLSKPVHLRFGLVMIHIVYLEEFSQTITIKSWLRFRWYNEIMTWNPNKWSNITSTRAHPDEVWTPDIYMLEEKGEKLSVGPDEYKTNVVMRHNGEHNWYIPVLLKSSCHFKVEKVPFDDQVCKFNFMSWTYDEKELTVSKDPADMLTEYYINSTEWKLVSLTSRIIHEKYNCCPNRLIRVEYTLKLHREPLYYAINVIAPCFIQMLIILSTFFLPPETGERVGISLTVLLVFAVYVVMQSSDLPKTSKSLPILTKFYLLSIGGTAFSIMATCFVFTIHFKGLEKGIGPVPKLIRHFFFEFLGQYSYFKSILKSRGKSNTMTMKNLGRINRENSYVLDETMDGQSKMETKNYLIGTLRYEVHLITLLIQNQLYQDEIEEEWRNLARIFDRIFFLFFCLYFITISMLVFLPVYVNDTILHAKDQYP